MTIFPSKSNLKDRSLLFIAWGWGGGGGEGEEGFCEGSLNFTFNERGVH